MWWICLKITHNGFSSDWKKQQHHVDSESLLFKDGLVLSRRRVVLDNHPRHSLKHRGGGVKAFFWSFCMADKNIAQHILCLLVCVLCGTTRLWNQNPKQQQPRKVGHVPVEVLLWGMLEVIYLCFTRCWHLSLFLMDWFQTTMRDTEYSHFLCQLKHRLQLLLMSWDVEPKLWFWIFSAIKYKLCLLQIIF